VPGLDGMLFRPGALPSGAWSFVKHLAFSRRLDDAPGNSSRSADISLSVSRLFAGDRTNEING